MRGIANAIGIRYLWVDALCIVQDNDAIKTRVVAYMHHIYGGAAVTIVAVDSAHAHAGLPGVGGGTRQLHQVVSQVDGLRLMARLCYLDVTLNRSKYNLRGWTFQECCLSNRLLYVTSKGVVYHCSQGVRREEMMFEDEFCGHEGCHKHTNYMSLNKRNLWRDYIGEKNRRQAKEDACSCIHEKQSRFLAHQLPASIQSRTIAPIEKFHADSFACSHCIAFEIANETELHTYRQLVRGYTHRQVRYESDRIPAFAGIAGLLAGQYDTGFWFGIPEKHLDFALLWIPRRRNSPTPRRKAGLAHVSSWSWASHEIAIDYRGDNWMASEVDWYLLAEDGRLRPVYSLKQFGAAMPMRNDFTKSVSLDQLHVHGILGASKVAGEPSGPSLVGWCQVANCFSMKGYQLYGPEKQLVYMPSKEVYWSYAAPAVDEPHYHPVELLFLSGPTIRRSRRS